MRRARAAHPRADRASYLDAGARRRRVRLHRRLRRQAADGRHLRAASACRRPTATSCAGSPTCSCTARTASTTCRPPGIEAAHHALRLLRRHARRAAPAAPTDDLTSALLDAEIDGDRLTDEEIIGVPLPHGGGRQRDHHQAARQRAVLGAGATPTSGPGRSPTPTAIARLGRGDAALRHVEPDARPHRRRRTSSCTARRIPGGRRGCCCSSARPTATTGVFPDADELRPRPRHAAASSLSFGGGRHFCLGANLARLEAQRRARRAGHAGSRTFEVDAAGAARASTPSTCAASPPCRSRWRCADAQVRPTPTAGPPSSPAPPRASAPPPRWRSPRPAIPVALGARRHRPSARSSPTQIRDARRRGGRAAPRRHRRRLGRRRSPRRATSELGDVEVVVSNAGDVAPGADPRGRHRPLRPRRSTSTSSAPTAWSARVRAGHGRAPARRLRLRDLRRAPSAPRPFMSPYAAASAGSRAWRRPMQMELEGTGVRVRIVRPGRPRPRWACDWDAPTVADVRHRAVERVGPRPAPALPAAVGRRRRRSSPSSARRAACT